MTTPIVAQAEHLSDSLSGLQVTSLDRSQRRLGETEASYYLPSRENGVNDMYLHLGFNAPTARVTRNRIHLVWAILRLRHPLLASHIEMHNYNDIRFVHDNPRCVQGVLDAAQRNLEFRSQTKDELIDGYLNGGRTLSNERLSYLVVSSQSPFLQEAGEASGASEQNIDLLICATHFIGDGMALHTFANHFFGLLGGILSEHDLKDLLNEEFKHYHGNDTKNSAPLPFIPKALEDRLPPLPKSKLFKAATKIDFRLSQRKLIGGHSFPKRHNQPRRTIVPTVSFDPSRTKAILQNCKANGVSISSALFAVCNIAWARTYNENRELPIMMYSALNIRPYLRAEKTLNDSYWFIAIGYFNVILPAFIPQSGDIKAIFWHRARSAKKQSSDIAKHPLVVPRSLEMARERGTRARVWAKEDDDKAAGVISAPAPAPPPSIDNTPVSEKLVPSSKMPSTALIGLSLLGNLDGMYKHPEFPEIKLHTLTTGSRQRSGGMLLFGYTFVGKLWVSLGYDENGFDKEVVDRFWINVLSVTNELL